MMIVSLLGGTSTMAKDTNGKTAVVSISEKKLKLNVGSKYTLKLSGASATVRWESSNRKVATVSQKGVVKAKGIGRATITASLNGKKYKCKVTVKEKNKVNTEYIYAYVGDKALKIKLADNSSAAAFAEYLSEGDVSIKMSDYGNFEKVGDLGTTLPRNDEDITTEAGDVILYLGNKITIYYDTNSWDFTRLGKVQGVSQSELKDILGDGDVKIRFSLK
jgi:hypothetical protein